MAKKTPDTLPDEVKRLFGEGDNQGIEIESQGNALLSVCKYVGSKLDLRIVAPSYRTAEKSNSFAGAMTAIAQSSEVRIRPLSLTDEWWTTDAGPLVALTTTGVPCALIPDQKRGYSLFTPEQRNPIKITAENAKEIAPLAYTFYRSFPDIILDLKQIIVFSLSHLWKDFWKIILYQSVIAFVGLFIPIATGLIIETVIPTANITLLGHFIIALVVLSFATTSFNISQSISMMRLKLKANISAQSAVWDRVLKLPLSFFNQFSSGDLADRIKSIDSIQQTLTGVAFSGILSGIFSVFTLGLIFFYDPTIAIMVLFLAILAGLFSSISIYFQIKYSRILLMLRGKNANLVYQMLNGISKLRSHGRETLAFLRWSKSYTKIADLYKNVETMNIWMNTFLSSYNGLFTVAFFIMVMWRIDTLTFAKFVALNAAVAQFRASFMKLFELCGEVLNIVPTYERMTPILKVLPESDKTAINPGKIDGEIIVRNLSFYYKDKNSFVFGNLNLRFESGKFIALVGPSGAGKSTLFRLLLGFETPQEGQVLYDGKNIAALNIRQVRRQIGVVLQTTTLLPGSILHNIIGNNFDLTVEDAWEAARLAGIDKDIKNLPMGMHTALSEEGRTFSMGQRQRLMIARALATHPKILFLDEATSALDNETQALIQKSLKKLEVTRIVAAHRISTIMNADWIYVFNEKGKVVQQGKYAKLKKEKGLFSDLAKRQNV